MRTPLLLLAWVAASSISPAPGFAQSREQYRECQAAVSQRLNRPISDISTRSGPRISNGNTIVNWDARTDRGRLSGSCEAAPNGRIVDIDLGNAGGGGGGFGGGFGNGGNGNGAERSCRTEVSRRTRVRQNSISTQVTRQNGNRTEVSWSADGGQRGSCEVDRNLRVVDFREDRGNGGGWSGNDRPGFGGGRGVSIRAQISGRGGDGKCTFEVEVDGVAEVEISGDRGYLRTLSGTPATWRRLDCNRAMPRYPENFRFQGIDGRGRQDLVRDPGSNGGTAVVRIEDPKGGREGYTGDVKWR